MMTTTRRTLMMRNSISSISSIRYKSTITNTTTDIAVNESPDFVKRFKVTAEVTISKIFPAGFGWQCGSIVAASSSIPSSSLSFALLTGFGDMTGVILGHTLFYSLKKASLDPAIDVVKETHTALFLGTAAFCSGFVWQPAVNVLQAAGTLPFSGVVLGAWAAGTIAFFTGLRFGRKVYSPVLYVAKGNDKNFKDDVMLSAAIGGAAGGFVGTDTAYLGAAGNPLKEIVGITGQEHEIVQMIKAGQSTSIGFIGVQTAQNLSNSKGQNWTD